MLVSIIVPVYNVEKYINQCLDSLISLDRMKVKIILVIGRSDDKSNDICQAYVGRYENISIVQQNGKGLSNARNCALQNIDTEYVTFVDSDDYVVTSRLQRLINMIEQIETDVAEIDMFVSDFVSVSEESRQINIRNQIIETEQFLQSEYTMEFLQSGGSIWNVWRYIYRTEFLKRNNLRFLEGYLCEDVEFTSNCFLKAHQIYYLHNPYYCYRPYRVESLYNKKTIKNAKDLLEIAEVFLNENREQTSIYMSKIIDRICREIVLGLPMIHSMERADRKKAVSLYQSKIEYIRMGNQRLTKLAYVSIRLLGIWWVSYVLYLIQKLRRKVLYHVR